MIGTHRPGAYHNRIHARPKRLHPCTRLRPRDPSRSAGSVGQKTIKRQRQLQPKKGKSPCDGLRKWSNQFPTALRHCPLRHRDLNARGLQQCHRTAGMARIGIQTTDHHPSNSAFTNQIATRRRPPRRRTRLKGNVESGPRGIFRARGQSIHFCMGRSGFSMASLAKDAASADTNRTNRRIGGREASKRLRESDRPRQHLLISGVQWLTHIDRQAMKATIPRPPNEAADSKECLNDEPQCFDSRIQPSEETRQQKGKEAFSWLIV